MAKQARYEAEIAELQVRIRQLQAALATAQAHRMVNLPDLEESADAKAAVSEMAQRAWKELMLIDRIDVTGDKMGCLERAGAEHVW